MKNVFLLVFIIMAIVLSLGSKAGEFSGAGLRLNKILASKSLNYDRLVTSGHEFIEHKSNGTTQDIRLSRVKWMIARNKIFSLQDISSLKLSNDQIIKTHQEELLGSFLSDILFIKAKGNKYSRRELQVLIIK